MKTAPTAPPPTTIPAGNRRASCARSRLAPNAKVGCGVGDHRARSESSLRKAWWTSSCRAWPNWSSLTTTARTWAPSRLASWAAMEPILWIRTVRPSTGPSANTARWAVMSAIPRHEACVSRSSDGCGRRLMLSGRPGRWVPRLIRRWCRKAGETGPRSITRAPDSILPDSGTNGVDDANPVVVGDDARVALGRALPARALLHVAGAEAGDRDGDADLAGARSRIGISPTARLWYGSP